MAYISRDPFARQELHRGNEFSETDVCANCGMQRQAKGTNRAYLYRFRIETDTGHVYHDGSKFCSKSCRDSYYS